MTDTVLTVTHYPVAELLGDALADYLITEVVDGRAPLAGLPGHVATWLAEHGHRIVPVATDQPGLDAMEVLAPIIEAAGPDALAAWVTILVRLRDAEQANTRLKTLTELRATTNTRAWLKPAGRP